MPKKRKGLGWRLPFGLLLVILVVAIFAQTVRQPLTNPETFCPEEKDLGLTAFVIDVSDKLTDSQSERLKNELRNISNISADRSSALLEKGERMLVYFVEPEGQMPSMVFSKCHPGDIANRPPVDNLFEGKFLAQRKWEKFTTDLMESVVPRIKGSTEMNTSPIIEAIQYVRAKHFPPPDLMDGAENYRIVLWSDLLQNSLEGRHLDEDLGDFKSVFRRNPINLSGVDLFVFQFTSKKYLKHQTNEHAVWWRKFFAAADADMNLWEKL